MAKRKLTVWVEEDIADRVEMLARTERLTVSQFGAALLERAVTQWADNTGWDVVGIRVEDAVRKEVGRMSDRLAQLIVRGTLEATATRALIFNDRMQQATSDEGREDVKRANTQAWSYAVDRLKTPVQAVKELLSSM